MRAPGSGRPLLEGVRVLDLTHMLAGPYGTRLLADLGAEVIKVEPPGGDPMRRMGPHFVKGESAYFLSISANKKSLGIDLKDPRGRKIFLDLVKKADAVVENFRPGILDSLGLGYDALREANPRILLCSLSGYGQTGPDRDRPAFDLSIQAYAGAMSLTGHPGGPPARMGVPMGDLAGGMFVALSVAAALYRRSVTGEGARIDLALSDSLLSLQTYIAQFFLSVGEVMGPQGHGHRWVVPYGAFRTADDWIVVAAFAENFWRALARALEREDLLEDPRFQGLDARSDHHDLLHGILEKTLRERPADEWLERLTREGVPCSRVNRVDQALSEPHTEHREMVVTVEHPTAGKVRMLGNPVKVAGIEDRFAPPPLLGQETDELLGSLLGYGQEEIARLKGEGIVR